MSAALDEAGQRARCIQRDVIASWIAVRVRRAPVAGKAVSVAACVPSPIDPIAARLLSQFRDQAASLARRPAGRAGLRNIVMVQLIAVRRSSGLRRLRG